MQLHFVRLRSPDSIDMKALICLTLLNAAFVSSQNPLPDLPPLDLFVSKEEAQRIVGTSAEIYYITKGVTNSYSQGFFPMVLYHIPSVSLCWSMNGKTIPEVDYTINVRPMSSESMDQVTLSIPNTGQVPVDKQEFTINMPCNGRKSEETLVTIEITFRTPNQVFTADIKRVRICKALSGVKEPQPTLPAPNRFTNEDGIYAPNADPASTSKIKIDWIILVSVIGFVFMLFFVAICVLMCKPKKKPQLGHDSSANRELIRPVTPALINTAGSHQGTVISAPRSARESLQGGNYYSSTAEVQESLLDGRSYNPNDYTYEMSMGFRGHPPSLLSQCSHPRTLPPTREHLEIDPELIEAGAQVCAGNFGVIRRGRLLDPENGEESIDILIKTTKTGCSHQSLILQGFLLYGLEDLHVCGAIGFVTGIPEPMVIYRSYHSECLKTVLVSQRNSRKDDPGRRFSLIELIELGVQALEGLMFIHGHGIVHKDIAARNCLLTPDSTLQITDAALSKDLHPEDYVCLGDNENRPVKWMALESLKMNEFSTASDVWSFGILMWEILSLGQTPYEEVDGFDVADYVGDGVRVGKPCDTCPTDFWNEIYKCWSVPPGNRPKVDELLRYISAFHQNLANHYV